MARLHSPPPKVITSGFFSDPNGLARMHESRPKYSKIETLLTFTENGTPCQQGKFWFLLHL